MKLAKIDPNDTGGLEKKDALPRLAEACERIAALQERLYAENRRALLVVLQGMDTSGKTGTVKAVFSKVHPMGLEIRAFGPPSALEADHDFLWRASLSLPRRGNIAAFDRSYYEDVLVVRVKKLVPEKVWKHRFRQINAWEHLVTDQGTRILKFLLHIDRAEQKERLEARLADEDKLWKFRPGDLEDRARWDDFQEAYQDVVERCAAVVPWTVVPANKKWYRNLVVAEAVVAELEEMAPRPPRPDFDPAEVKIPD